VNAQSAVRRRLGIGLLVVCASLLCASCAAGQEAQTSNEVAAVDANSGQVGSMLLRAVAIKAPPNGVSYARGDVAELDLVIVNNGTSADTLTGVSSPVASTVRVFNTRTEASAAARPTPSSASASSSSAAPSSSSSTSGTASGTGTASVSPSTSAAPKPPTLKVARGQTLSIGAARSDAILDLVLNRSLFPGPSVPITFDFAKAGSVTIRVPVQLTEHSGSVGITVPEPSSGAEGG
jgi:copper(I)-binding protein